MKPFRVWREVYAIGGPELSHPYDCCVYLIGGVELVLIDSGAGEGFDQLVDNIKSIGFKPEKLRAVVATHAHIDHIGALSEFREKFGSQVIAHELDADASELPCAKSTGRLETLPRLPQFIPVAETTGSPCNSLKREEAQGLSSMVWLTSPARLT